MVVNIGCIEGNARMVKMPNMAKQGVNEGANCKHEIDDPIVSKSNHCN